MVCLRLRDRWPWLALVVVPGLAWVLVVLLLPTDWIKRRLSARLEAETGRTVTIGAVRLGWLGGLRIDELTLAERSRLADPWLRVGATAININPLRVLLGCCQPTTIEVDQAELRIWRQSDGQCEIGDLATHRPAHNAARRVGVASDQNPPIRVRVARSTVVLRDDVDDLHACLTGIDAEASYQSSIVELKRLQGQLNGGTLKLAAHLTRGPDEPSFAAEVRARQVRLDPGLHLIQTFLPLVARADQAIDGRLNVHLAIQGRGSSAATIGKTVQGHGSILLDPIDLANTCFLNELRVLGEWPRENHAGTVSANFVVGQGRFQTDDLTIQAARLPFVVAGWTDFEGRFDFGTRIDRMIGTIPREARSLLGELSGNFEELGGLRIQGRRSEAHLSLNGRPLEADLGQSDAARQRFRATARKIRDRFFR